MNKLLTLIGLWLISLAATPPAPGQAKTLNGVYAGLELTIPVVMGQGMGRNDNVVYFRPDGTFTDDLKRPDWKTHVKGTYQVTGKQVKLTYPKSRPWTLDLDPDGDLDAGSYMMLRLPELKTVPPGFYKFTSASSSGGGSSGMVFVGSSGETGLYFDGKGHFSRNRSSATMVAGDNIGGGGSNKDSGSGTYTLVNGQLTLKFDNGTTEKHSFFSRPTEKPIMAAVDGNIYFMKDEKEAATATKKAPRSTTATKTPATAATTKTPATTPTATSSAEDKPAATPTDAQTLLRAANRAHGGPTLDALRTLEITGVAAGMQALVRMDLAANKMRVELRNGQRLVSVEQLENGSGWQWRNGKQRPLAADRLLEMKHALRTGVLGLQTANLQRLSPRLLPAKNGLVPVAYQLDGADYVFFFDENHHLVAEGNNLNRVTKTFSLSGLKTVDGVLLPSQEDQTIGALKQSLRYSNYRLNPPFGPEAWTVPQ